MHEIKMMKLETDIIMVESVEPVLFFDVVMVSTSIVLVFKQCFDRDRLKKDELYSFAVIRFDDYTVKY